MTLLPYSRNSFLFVRIKPFCIRYAEKDWRYNLYLQYCIRYAEKILIIAAVLQYVTFPQR
jgi:hypothetical protein